MRIGQCMLQGHVHLFVIAMAVVVQVWLFFYQGLQYKTNVTKQRFVFRMILRRQCSRPYQPTVAMQTGGDTFETISFDRIIAFS